MTSFSRPRAEKTRIEDDTSRSLGWRLPTLGLLLFVAFTLLVAYILSAAFAAPPPWTLQVGASGDTRFSTGFFLAEQSEDVPFRWAGPEARFVFHGADATPLALEMRLNGDQIVRSGDARLSVVAEHPTASGPFSTTIQVATGWQRYHILLPPSAAGLASPAYDLVSGTSRPGPQDGRDLGAAVSTVRLLPIAGGTGLWLLRGWPLHPRAIFFAGALAVLFWGGSNGIIWLLAFRKRRDTLVSRAQVQNSDRVSRIVYCIVGALVLLLALGLVVWARTNPYTLAVLLPPLPWTLGVCVAALLSPFLVKGVALVQQQARLSSPVLLWSGIALLLVDQGLLNGQTFVPLALALAFLALALLVVAERTRTSADDIPPNAVLSSQSRWWAQPRIVLGGIFLLALLLRFYELASLPYGLWRDEARHGLVALRILDDPTYRPIYVAEAGVNMPALIFYPFALALKLWGIHPWTMRPLTALAGTFTVLPLYGLTRRMFGVRPALVAALLYAVSAWHLTVSRFSFPTVFDPLFGLTALWLLIIAWESTGRATRFAAWFGSGVCMGLAIQTYHTGRVVPIIGGLLAVGLLWETVRHSKPQRGSAMWLTVRRWFGGMLIVAVSFLLVAGPMLWYALTKEAEFNDRVSGVFLLSESALNGRAPLAALDETLGKHLLLFNVRGDENGRHAPPNRPGLDFVSGLGFLAGVALLLRRRPNGGWPGMGWRGPFLFAAIGLSLLPSALAVDAPHGMRGVGAIAFACIVAALGLEWLWQQIGASHQEARSSLVSRISRFASPVLIAALVLAVALNYYTYFIWMKADPAVWVSFYPVHTQAGAYVREIRDHDPNRQIFVAAGVATNPVFVYLTYGYTVQTFDAGVASEPLRPGAIFILSGYTYTKDREILAPYLGSNPQPLVIGPDFPDGRSPSFVAYPATQPAAARR